MELTEIFDGSGECPIYYQPPYYILQKGKNVFSQYEFLARRDVLNKYGRRKYFDVQFLLAD